MGSNPTETTSSGDSAGFHLNAYKESKKSCASIPLIFLCPNSLKRLDIEDGRTLPGRGRGFVRFDAGHFSNGDRVGILLFN